MRDAPRIYNLFPLLAGPLSSWPSHFDRIADMAFDWVYVNPVHYPGFSGSLYAVKDYRRLHPLLQGAEEEPADTLLRRTVEEAERRGLKLMLDLVVNHTARDADLVAERPQWYVRDERGEVVSPRAVDPDDTRNVTVWGDLAELDYNDRPERHEMLAYWGDLARHYVRLGFHGFRCDAAYKIPGAAWQSIIAAARDERRDLRFAAETLGAKLEEVAQLHEAGFDYFFNSSKWWDFHADWLLDQYEQFRHVAPSIAFPESHDTERLITELSRQGVHDPEAIAAHYRLRYLFAATFSTGVMMPMGFEHGFGRKLDVVSTRPEEWDEQRARAPFDLTGFVHSVNRMKIEQPALCEEGPQRRVTPPHGAPVGLLRHSGDRRDVTLTLLNIDPHHQHRVDIDEMSATWLGGPSRSRDVTPGLAPEEGEPTAAGLILPPLGFRVFSAGRETAARAAQPAVATATAATTVPPRRAGRRRTAAQPSFTPIVPDDPRRVVIEGVHPELDGGRHPVKREVGDVLEVWADIFMDGHDAIAAVLLVRAADQDEWQEAPMRFHDNDRWVGRFPLARNTRYHYTIEAWHDVFESWRAALEKKLEAGQNVSVELEEGRRIVEAALDRADRRTRESIKRSLDAYAAARNDAARGDILLSPELRTAMAMLPDRSGASRYDRELEVVVDRVAARFSAWYEMFPRSQGSDPTRSATFKECERRLPEIRDLGFDVVYLVPIHPIGRTHRKGPNNSLVAGPHDPGSPYAIGSEEGGHKAIHPDLGTLEDFRHFVAECHRHGMEVALDFAIQAAPDHPWIREHPEWFIFRPDGTIKYAENPPKKYQDIVNVNFYGPHQQALWNEMKDTILFWIEQGVKIFRVDNPHTKPIYFWEWLIRDIQRRHPETIFLSEAFTRPKVMKRLAKVGFTQSYTYFTWRNFKNELTEYLTELTQTEVAEYLRPHFFPNTPDILPYFLQTGGRPAFRIRLVLAGTLSPLYGIYNGFELCENRAVPGKEEYADSEKYQYKVWDWNRPGNIKDDIRKLNRFRRENPALRELTNLRFHHADNGNVLFYGKMTPDRSNMVFVCVNLDPFEPHEAHIHFPLDLMGVAPDETFEAEELFTGTKHLWRGARQWVHLDPHHNPAEIFRIRVWHPVNYREPCF